VKKRLNSLITPILSFWHKQDPLPFTRISSISLIFSSIVEPYVNRMSWFYRQEKTFVIHLTTGRTWAKELLTSFEGMRWAERKKRTFLFFSSWDFCLISVLRWLGKVVENWLKPVTLKKSFHFYFFCIYMFPSCKLSESEV